MKRPIEGTFLGAFIRLPHFFGVAALRKPTLNCKDTFFLARLFFYVVRAKNADSFHARHKRSYDPLMQIELSLRLTS